MIAWMKNACANLVPKNDLKVLAPVVPQDATNVPVTQGTKQLNFLNVMLKIVLWIVIIMRMT